MAINFAAANMAGYNNPQIEVFEVIYPPEGSTLIDFPRKSVILDCIKRGTVPVLMATNTDRTEIYILYLSTLASTAEKYLIAFSSCSKPSSADPPIIVTVYYELDSETPAITFEPVTVSNL